jgi:hypothetical protein
MNIMTSKLNYLVAIIVLFLFAVNDLSAQDKIYIKNKDKVIEANVIEIGTGEIKYRLWEEKEDGVVYVLEKRAISHIEFKNGRTEYYGQETMDLEAYFEGQKRRAVKVSFLGIMNGSLSFQYEQNLKPGRSIEANATFVGPGLKLADRDAKGFIAAFGYKLYKKPSFVTADLRRRHILQGGYFKPEIFMGQTSYNQGIFGWGDERESSTSFGFLLNLGKQWVVGESVVIDLCGGIGYGGGTSLKAYVVQEDINIAGSFKLNIGFIF